MDTSPQVGLRIVPIDQGSASQHLLSDLVQQVERLPDSCGNCEHFARVHDTVLRTTDRISRLVSASRIETGQTDLERVARSAVDRARRLMSSRMGGLFTLDEDGTSVKSRCLRGFQGTPTWTPESVEVLRLPHTRVAVVRTDDLREHPEATELTDTEPAMGPFLAVPLAHNSRALGTLFVANAPGDPPFSEEDESLLLAYAAQVAVVLENERLHAQSEQLSLLQERQRLAQMLHNTVAQGLFTIGLEAGWCLDHAPLDPQVKKRLRAIRRLTASSACQLRGAIHALSNPRPGEGSSLIDLLQEQVRDFEARTGVTARLIAPSVTPAALPEQVTEAIYRIACESLANVQKHASAEAVIVTLRCDPSSASITVQDDGVGLSEPDSIARSPDTLHFGVAMMRQLTNRLHGIFSITNADDGGVVVRARFDLSEAAAP